MGLFVLFTQELWASVWKCHSPGQVVPLATSIRWQATGPSASEVMAPSLSLVPAVSVFSPESDGALGLVLWSLKRKPNQGTKRSKEMFSCQKVLSFC